MGEWTDVADRPMMKSPSHLSDTKPAFARGLLQLLEQHGGDAPMGPKTVRSTVLTTEEQAAILAFRKHTLLL